MVDPKQAIINLLVNIEKGVIPAENAWDEIKTLKEEYVRQLNQQSWNSFIGHRFQGMIHSILKGYIKKIREENRGFKGFEVLTDGEAKTNDVIMRKLAIRYGDYLLLPDVDSVVVWIDSVHLWESEILAIISCKTSLRERIAQACYWKLKLLSSDVQKGIRVFLATADHDNDFNLKEDVTRFDGKSRDRIISEYELDGIYILREDFKAEWESSKVKKFDHLFNDLLGLLRGKGKS